MIGWITPKKEMVECGQWAHIDSIWETESLSRYIPNINELKAEVDEAYAGCKALDDRDEHGEWHCYEMALDGARWEVVETLYKAGCIRAGKVNGEVHLEGKPQAYKQLKPFLDSQFPKHVFTPRKS